MNDETNFNDADFEFEDEQSGATPDQDSTGKAVGFHVASSFRDVVAARPTGTSTGRPLIQVVEHLLMNGCGDVWADHVQPVVDGKISHGKLAANKAVLGYELMNADKAKDNLISTARKPKSYGDAPIDAELVGAAILRIAKKTYVIESRSFVATGLLGQG